MQPSTSDASKFLFGTRMPNYYSQYLDIPVDQYGEIKCIASDVGYLSGSFGVKRIGKSDKRTIYFWDILDYENPAKLEYNAEFYNRPVMRPGRNCCFFTDETSAGGAIGVINSQTYQLKKTPYNWAHLSVEDTKGTTIGQTQNTCKLMFWDLAKMQEVSTIEMGWQGRNLCAIVPGQMSNLVVTLQSGTHKTANVISLWDSRTRKKPVAEKIISDDGDIYAMTVLETFNGPRIVTHGTNSRTIDLRNIFDKGHCFGGVMNNTEVPQGFGPYSAYDISFLNSTNGRLLTSTKKAAYTGAVGFSSIIEQTTIRAYNFKEIGKEGLELKLTFSPTTTESPEHSFSFDKEKIVFVAPESKKLFTYIDTR